MIEIKTEHEKQREENHAQVLRLYRLISTKAARKGVNCKPARIYRAVAEETRKIGMRGGAGYTPQSIYNIVNNNK